VADAAHELRTPLTALRLQVQTLLRATRDDVRTQAGSRLLEGLDRATRLVEQLLVLARQEAPGDQEFPAAGTDLAEIAALTVGDVLPMATAKGVDLGMEPGERVMAAIPGDSLRVLLGNLLENAVKYAPVGGTVDLAIRAEGGRALLRVADNGPGIAPADRERVFDRFCRLHGQEVPGSGLGLAIVKTIADRWQGHVTLGRAERLGGLEATVSLPSAPEVR
jgi:two-component system OmpR family sensor kinase